FLQFFPGGFESGVDEDSAASAGDTADGAGKRDAVGAENGEGDDDVRIAVDGENGDGVAVAEEIDSLSGADVGEIHFGLAVGHSGRHAAGAVEDDGHGGGEAPVFL